jgi:hypothetical protein
MILKIHLITGNPALGPEERFLSEKVRKFFLGWFEEILHKACIGGDESAQKKR